MADAAISGLVSDVLGKLTSLAIEEFGLVCGFKRDISSLKEEFTLITNVLKDAEKKHEDRAVESWLKSIRYESLKMENLLDDVSAEAMLRMLHKELGFKYRVRAFFSSNHNPLIFRTRMAHKVKNIRIRFDELKARRSILNLTPSATSSADEGVAGEMPYREITSFIHSEDVLGRDEEINRVTGEICNTDSNILVYTIWGMGGLGKTTLAQLVYKDERVKQHFDFKCWIYVSQNFQVDELIRRIIKLIDESERELSDLEQMQNCLREKLRGKRFLIVLDDVWIRDSDMNKWQELSKTLRCGAQGSIVMVTTREMITKSQMMEGIPRLQHPLGCLSEEDSWSLFKKFAFAEGRLGGDITELEPIGKEIVEKCKGLPLAVKTLGGLMWLKSSLAQWKLVRDSDIWLLQQDDILPVLKLSYDNLPPHVKQCFAYCCMLPKGHEMGKDLLILLWKANRLIPSRGNADLYLLGEEIFNCLVWRSFFQVVDKEYKMHDLMHDLASSVMVHDCLIIEPGKQLKVPNEMLHLSSSWSDFRSSQPDLEKLKSLRSAFIFEISDEDDISHILDHVYLRVLYLAGKGSKILLINGLKTLPESICKLKHLRYLNLSKSDIEVLSESIIHLQNLQVLLLNGCRLLRKLPDGMRYMRNLQYLGISGCDSLGYLPVGIGKLTGLRSLTAFPVPENDGAQIGELGSLNVIGPYLNIKGLDRVKGGLREAQSADLKSKRNLLVLELDWRYPSRRDHDDEEVLEGLEPNPKLEKLEISRYCGKSISPSWMVNLRSLVQINLSYCDMCEDISTLGKLPSLRVIELEFMKSLKGLDDDDNILFPQLQVLHIHFCDELVSLPGNLPKLKVLELVDNRKLLSLPGDLPKLEVLDLLTKEDSFSLPDEIRDFKYLNTLKITGPENLTSRYEKDIGEDWPKISHIPNISIELYEPWWFW